MLFPRRFRFWQAAFVVLGVIAIVLLGLRFRNSETTVDDDERPEPVMGSSEVPQRTGNVVLDSESVDSVAPAEELVLAPRISVGFADLEEIDASSVSHRSQHVLKEWKGRLGPSLPLLDRYVGTEESVYFSMPSGEPIPVRLTRHDVFSDTKGVYSGVLPEQTGGEVFLSYVNDAVGGGLQIPGRSLAWEVRNAGEGLQYIALVDTKDLGECGVCNPPDNSR